ncbi:MAG: hypothetical protein WBJ62_04225 [Coriobacteriia bacterium]
MLALTAACVAAVAIPLASTSTPEFFSRYHLLERRYVNLEDSAHEGIGCRSCHETRPTANAVALVTDYYAGMISAGPTPKFFTFSAPTNDACLQCHSDDWGADSARTGRIPHPAHQRVEAETRPCTGCHKWTAHFEQPYLDQHKEMPFSGVCVAYGCHVGTKTTDECYDCHHVLHESSDSWRTEHAAVARKTGQNACVEACHTIDECQLCHTTGERPVFDGLPIETSMRSIEQLHVRDDWTEVYHGAEALAGRDRCLLCHQSQGECDECHLERPEFHGPTVSWIGRHSDQSTGVDDPRCLECHERAWCVDCHDRFKEME